MKTMIELERLCDNPEQKDREIFIDPNEIASIIPVMGGSLITMEQKTFFRVIQPPRLVMHLCADLGSLKAEESVNGNN